MKVFKIFLFITIILIIFSFYFFGGQKFLDLHFLQQKLSYLHSLYLQRPVYVITVFFTFYIILTGLSIPGAIVLTLMAGALFGTWPGAIIVTLANAVGATIAFILSRFLFRDFVEKKFRNRFIKFTKKLNEEGNLYLLTLRLIPITPFVVVNLVMGLTKIKIWSFIWITLLGIFPGTFIYVYAGKKFSEISTISHILSPSIIISLIFLGMMPFVARKISKLLILHRREHLKQ